jgi:carbonic anhydrase
MTDDGLDSLLAGLKTRAQQSAEADPVGPDSGTVLVVSCSMAQCRHDLSLWPVDSSRTAHPLPTLGTQTWTRHDGQLAVDDTLTHSIATTDVEAILVVGHTDCDVVADAYDQWLTPSESVPAGISARLDPLVSLVDDAVEAGIVDSTMPARTARHHLVEYNVVRQVGFLTERLPAELTLVGYVHDQDGVYDVFPGKRYLITVDGHTEAAELASRVPTDESAVVGSLCH